MPVYIDTKKLHDQENLEQGSFFALAGDLSGNTYIRQSMYPSSGFTYSNLPSKYATNSVTGTVQSSGTVYAFPLYLPGGFIVQHLSYVLGTTTASALTHRWAALATSAGVVVASSADDTTAVPTVSTIITQDIATASGAAATAYKVPSTFVASTTPEGQATLYYFLLMMAGTTIGSLANVQASLAAVSTSPLSGSTSLTSKTVALVTDGTITFTPASITSLITVPWVGVS